MSGHGGSRVGSGRKPEAVLTGVDGGKSPLSEPPVDLPEDQKAFWRTWAKWAIEAGTLNERTEAGWRELCKLESLMRRYEAVIEKDGETFIKCTVDGTGSEHQELKAHPLIGKHLALAKMVSGEMARFMLTSFGKPTTATKSNRPAANPWARVAAK